jgi:hypothetical protein
MRTSQKVGAAVPALIGHEAEQREDSLALVCGD